MLKLLKNKRSKILHYPRLDTVLMVEETIQKLDFYPTKTQLWRALPRKVMYQTFELIVDYLVHSGKVVVKDGEIIWIWDPEGVKKYLKRKDLEP